YQYRLVTDRRRGPGNRAPVFSPDRRRLCMAVGYYFAPQSMSAQQYDEVLKRLEAAGQGSPTGRQYHVSFYEGDKLRVFDVWDSKESFEKFGQTLMPILNEVGIDAGEPMVAEVHKVITG